MLSPKDAADMHVGWSLADEGAGEVPEFADPSEAWGHAQDSLQTAGLTLKGLFGGRQSGRDTRSMMRQGDTPPALQLDREKVKGLIKLIPDTLGGQPLDQKFIDTGTLNLERSHEGVAPFEQLREIHKADPKAMLDAVENAEDLSKVFNVIGKELDLTSAPRTHASIKARTPEQLLNDLAPILDGRQIGLANDKQLYALSSMHAAVGDEVIAAARVIQSGRASDEVRASFMEGVEMLGALEAMLVGNTREVARALSARRIYANSKAFGNLEELTMAIERGGMTTDAIDKASGMLLSSLLKEGKINALHGVVKRATTLETLVEYWKSNVLSNPATHILNTGSNAAVLSYEKFAVDPMAAGISTARRALGLGKQEGVYFSEVAPGMHGAFVGMRDGLKSAMEIMLDPTSQGTFGATTKADAGGMAMVDMGGRMSQAVGMGERPGQWAGQIVGAPLRLMKAEDEVFKAVAYRSYLAQLQMRQGMDKGLSGPALTNFLDEALQNPSYDLHKQAMQFAEKVTFQDKGGGGLIGMTASHVTRYLEVVPVFKLVVPFVRTMANLISYAVDNSPLAVTALDVRAGTPLAERLTFFADITAGGARADYAMARFTMGSAMVGLAYTLYQAGIITGPGPDDPGQRRVMEKTGFSPNALIVGGKAYTFDRADPLASVFEMTTGAFDKARFAKKDQDATSHLMDAIMAFSNHMMNSTFMESSQRFMQIFFGADKAGPAAAKFAAGIATGFIPYSAALGGIARASDDKIRKPSFPESLGLGGKDTIADLGQIISQAGAMKLPWNRDELRPARYWDGEEIVPEASGMVRLLLPTRITATTQDKPSIELISNGIGAPEPIPQVTLGRITFNLLDFDLGKGMVYDAYIKGIGQFQRQAVEEVTASAEYQSAEKGVGSQRAIMLERAMLKGRKAGIQQFWVKTLPGMVQEKEVDLNMLANALGQSLEDTMEAIKKGDYVPSFAAGRFDAKGAPGKKEREIPLFTFD